MPTLTLITMTNKADSERGKALLNWEAEKLQFLRPMVSLVPNCESYAKYNENVLFNLHKYFDTDFVLITQFDARVVNPLAWTDDFFKYDYIGAPWVWRIMKPQYLKDRGGMRDKNRLVGNGGFSLRSRRLCKLLAEKYTGRLSPGEAEDVFICQNVRDELEAQGIKFAPYEVAERFSVENQRYTGQFGAHSSFVFNHSIYNMKKMRDFEIDKITAAIGYAYCAQAGG